MEDNFYGKKKGSEQYSGKEKIMIGYLDIETTGLSRTYHDITVIGIALENGMVLVTYLNQLVKDGVSIDEASVKGAVLRMRPVLMTALTTALGLIPLLVATGVGSEVQRPLATVVIGGLITSTVLTLLVIPAIYKWFSLEAVEES